MTEISQERAVWSVTLLENYTALQNSANARPKNHSNYLKNFAQCARSGSQFIILDQFSTNGVFVCKVVTPSYNKHVSIQIVAKAYWEALPFMFSLIKAEGLRKLPKYRTRLCPNKAHLS